MIIRSVIFETYNVIHQNGVKRDRTHNTANELQNIAAHDANGNMTLMPALKGKYDAWNRLIEVRNTNDVLIAQYEYNALNQRIKKTVGATITQSFFNENWQELESVTNNQLTTYIWGLRYVDDLILREKGNEKLYSIADPNWNVIAICDNTGNIAERIKYNAFGKITWLDENFNEKTNSDYSWNRTFTGQTLDIETGLMLYRNRYYHVELGRFVSRDPIGYDAGDENLYRYLFNHAVSTSDPYGLFTIPVPRIPPELPFPQLPDMPCIHIPCIRIPRVQLPLHCDDIIAESINLIRQHVRAAASLSAVYPIHTSMPHQHCVWNCRMVRQWSKINPVFADFLAISMSEQKERIDHAYADIRDKLLTRGCFHLLPERIKDKLIAASNSAGQPSDYSDNAVGRSCGKSIYTTCGSDWTADKECESCCTTAGVGPYTIEGTGTTRPWGPRHIRGL